MKHLLAYVFLFMFSFQVLPVKEMGKILFKGQMTEEIHECSTDCSGLKVKKDEDPYNKLQHFENANVRRVQYFTAKTTVALTESEYLPKQYVPEILTPPPNRA